MAAHKSFVFVTRSADETRAIGATVANAVEAGDVILFLADLGAGKTTFVQGLVKALGVNMAALSPTFVIAQTYDGRIPIHHLDFYRLSAKEILEMGAQDYLVGGGEIARGLVLIEWAERCRELWPKERLEISIRIIPKTNHREIKIRGMGKKFANLSIN